MSRRAAAKRFGTTPSAAVTWFDLRRKTGSAAPRASLTSAPAARWTTRRTWASDAHDVERLASGRAFRAMWRPRSRRISLFSAENRPCNSRSPPATIARSTRACVDRTALQLVHCIRKDRFFHSRGSRLSETLHASGAARPERGRSLCRSEGCFSPRSNEGQSRRPNEPPGF